MFRYRAEVKSLTRTLEQLQKHGATLGVPLPGQSTFVWPLSRLPRGCPPVIIMVDHGHRMKRVVQDDGNIKVSFVYANMLS